MTAAAALPVTFAARTGTITRILFGLSIPTGLLGAFICFGVATTEPSMTMSDRIGTAFGGLFFSIFFVVPLALWLMKRGRRIVATTVGIEDHRS